MFGGSTNLNIMYDMILQALLQLQLHMLFLHSNEFLKSLACEYEEK